MALQPATDSTARLLTLDGRDVGSYHTPLLTGDLIVDWAPDGSYALGEQQVGATGFDITRLDLRSDTGSAVPLIATTADEMTPRISPNGHWLAYSSNKTGRSEVYLTALPGAAAAHSVSTGGMAPENTGQSVGIAWSRDGHILYYIDATEHLMAVTIGTDGAIGRPVLVPGAPGGTISIDGAPGGTLLLLYDDDPDRVPLTIQTNVRAAVQP